MKEVEKIHNLYKLKEVERTGGQINGRFESVAEHTYSSLILAQYFLSKIKQKLDELKVMKMLLYHDMVELEAGDTFVLDEEGRKNQKENEHKAFEVLKKKIPEHLAEEAHELWHEYEDGKTMEAKFCNAIDKLDPIVQYIFSGEAWKHYKFTEKKLRERKEEYFKEFPVMLGMFNKFLAYAKENDYFYKEKN